MKDKVLYFVYELIKYDKVFYIGLTKNVDRRLYCHIRKYGRDIKMNIIFSSYNLLEARNKELETIIVEDFCGNILNKIKHKKVGYKSVDIQDNELNKWITII